MKRILKILAVIIIIVAVAIGALLYATSGAREVARNFVLNATSGAFEEAMASLHQEVAADFPVERMEEVFGRAKAYTEVSFSTVQASGGRTTLSGTATTADGCASEVDFAIVNDQIIAFNINPLCREQ